MVFLKLQNDFYVFLTHEKTQEIDHILYKEIKDYPLITYVGDNSAYLKNMRTAFLNRYLSKFPYTGKEEDYFWCKISLEDDEAQSNVSALLTAYCIEFKNMNIKKKNVPGSLEKTRDHMLLGEMDFEWFYYPYGKKFGLIMQHTELRGDNFLGFLKPKKKFTSIFEIDVEGVKAIEGTPRCFTIFYKDLELRFDSGHFYMLNC